MKSTTLHCSGHGARGFTLIELVVAMVISALLLAIAMPSYRTWVQNAQVRGVAEALLHALQKARAEAVRLNAPVTLTITAAGNGGATWDMILPPAASASGSSLTTLSDQNAGTVLSAMPVMLATNTLPGAAGSALAAPGSFSVTYNGLGTLEAATTVRRIDTLPISAQGGRALAIVMSVGGGLRLCDPAATRALSVQGC